MAIIKCTRSIKEDHSALMTCILRVNTRSSGWQKAVRGVLSSTRGVNNFRMDEYGTVQVSGVINPNKLLKKLGKAGKNAEVCWFQYGQCSENLFLHNNYTNNPHCYQMTSSCDEYGRYYPFRQAFQEVCLESSYAHMRPPAPPLVYEDRGCCTIM